MPEVLYQLGNHELDVAFEPMIDGIVGSVVVCKGFLLVNGGSFLFNAVSMELTNRVNFVVTFMAN